VTHEVVTVQYEAELERMLELKRQSMSIFIVNARTEIESLWDDLILGEEERQQFSGFWDGMSFSLFWIWVTTSDALLLHR
jgi:protein regulator of cytokinesis 1